MKICTTLSSDVFRVTRGLSLCPSLFVPRFAVTFSGQSIPVAFRALDPDKIYKAERILSIRVEQRFPKSGPLEVSCPVAFLAANDGVSTNGHPQRIHPP